SGRMHVDLALFMEVDPRCIALFFFFSSRRRHTRFKCDWSSDVCSSDLMAVPRQSPAERLARLQRILAVLLAQPQFTLKGVQSKRSEERREGKSGDIGGRRIIKKKRKKEGRQSGTGR